LEIRSTNIEFQNKSKVTKIQRRSSNAPDGACF
jgi:hypothetical protein